VRTALMSGAPKRSRGWLPHHPPIWLGVVLAWLSACAALSCQNKLQNSDATQRPAVDVAWTQGTSHTYELEMQSRYGSPGPTALFDFKLAKMKEYGIVDSGDTLTMGVNAMTDERWKSFYRFSVEAGMYAADLPLERGYTLKFVNKGVGLDRKRELLGK